VGPSSVYEEKEDIPQKMLSVLKKAGYAVIIPEGKDDLCCEWLLAVRDSGSRHKKRRMS
jgi:Fe-S oxidoreductase